MNFATLFIFSSLLARRDGTRFNTNDRYDYDIAVMTDAITTSSYCPRSFSAFPFISSTKINRNLELFEIQILLPSIFRRVITRSRVPRFLVGS